MQFVLDLDEDRGKEIPLTFLKIQVKSSGCLRKYIYPTSFSVCLSDSPWRSCLTSLLSRFACVLQPHSLPVCLDEVVRVTLDTKCPSVPTMWTTECSLILKLVNIDQWHHPCTRAHNTHTYRNAALTQSHHRHTHSHADDCHQPDRFTDNAKDKQQRDDTCSCTARLKDMTSWQEQLESPQENNYSSVTDNKRNVYLFWRS